MFGAKIVIFSLAKGNICFRDFSLKTKCIDNNKTVHECLFVCLLKLFLGDLLCITSKLKLEVCLFTIMIVTCYKKLCSANTLSIFSIEKGKIPELISVLQLLLPANLFAQNLPK